MVWTSSNPTLDFYSNDVESPPHSVCLICPLYSIGLVPFVFFTFYQINIAPIWFLQARQPCGIFAREQPQFWSSRCIQTALLLPNSSRQASDVVLCGWGWGVDRASLRFKKRLNFSINPRKLSIFNRSFSNRSEAQGWTQGLSNSATENLVLIGKERDFCCYSSDACKNKGNRNSGGGVWGKGNMNIIYFTLVLDRFWFGLLFFLFRKFSNVTPPPPPQSFKALPTPAKPQAESKIPRTQVGCWT